jgi:hypothetical protein
MKQKLLVAIAALFSFSNINAQVNQRQHNQQVRTKQGVKSGELTQAETAKIKTQQKHINQMEAKAKSDGVVTTKEKAKLNAAQNAASTSIYRKKHNKRDRN